MVVKCMMDCMGFTAFCYFYPYRVVEKVVTYPDVVKYLDLFFGVYNGWMVPYMYERILMNS
jgi:hypothetical protein